MNKPCEHCDRADSKREGYFKCEKPCNRARACYENDVLLFEILCVDLSKIEKCLSKKMIYEKQKT